MWADQVGDSFIFGVHQGDEIQRWAVLNATGEWHNFHIHGAVFRVLTRTDLEMGGSGSAATASEKGRPPAAYEAGDKDTVLMPPASVTPVLIHFGPYTGRFVYHCHMLEHEDDDMMRPYEIVP